MDVFSVDAKAKSSGRTAITRDGWTDFVIGVVASREIFKVDIK